MFSTSKPHKLRLLPSITNLLDEIKQEVNVSAADLVMAVYGVVNQQLETILVRNEFRFVDDYFEVEKALYATEDPSKLYLSFAIAQDCVDVSDQGRTGAILRMEGDGTYDTESANFSDIRLSRQNLSYLNEDGSRSVVVNMLALVGSAVIGHREVLHTVRYALER